MEMEKIFNPVLVVFRRSLLDILFLSSGPQEESSSSSGCKVHSGFSSGQLPWEFSWQGEAPDSVFMIGQLPSNSLTLSNNLFIKILHNLVLHGFISVSIFLSAVLANLNSVLTVLASTIVSFVQVGYDLKEEIERKFDKWQEPPPVKQVKPLPAPLDGQRKKRGGRRYRNCYLQSALLKSPQIKRNVTFAEFINKLTKLKTEWRHI